MMMGEQTAAAYLDLPVATFLRAVQHGELPRPRMIAGRRRWSRVAIDAALHPDIPGTTSADPMLAQIEKWIAA